MPPRPLVGTRRSRPPPEAAPSVGGPAEVSLFSLVLRERSLRLGLVAVVITFMLWEALAYAVTRGGAPLSGPTAPRELVAILLSTIRWIVLWTAGLYLAHRFPIENGRTGRIADALALSTLVLLVTHAAATTTMCVVPFTTCPGLDRHLLLLGGGLPLPIVCLGPGYAWQLAAQHRTRVTEAQRVRAEVLDAQVANLTMQLQPHFLFNALNSVLELMHTDRAAAKGVLARLQILLRTSMEKGDSQLVSVRDEVAVARLYTDIEMIRFSDRLDIEFAVDASVDDALLPQLLLQPLLENAIRHGISRLRERGRVRLGVRATGTARLEVTVADNGPGIPGDWTLENAGVGLTNTVARLDRLYGTDYELRLENVYGSGLCVRVMLPLRFAGEADARPFA